MSENEIEEGTTEQIVQRSESGAFMLDVVGADVRVSRRKNETDAGALVSDGFNAQISAQGPLYIHAVDGDAIVTVNRIGKQEGIDIDLFPPKDTGYGAVAADYYDLQAGDDDQFGDQPVPGGTKVTYWADAGNSGDVTVFTYPLSPGEEIELNVDNINVVNPAVAGSDGDRVKAIAEVKAVV